MYFSLYFLLLIISLGISLAAFFWGIRSGQFSDQERARYLALTEEITPSSAKTPLGRKPEAYAFLVIAILALSAMTASVVLVLRH